MTRLAESTLPLGGRSRVPRGRRSPTRTTDYASNPLAWVAPLIVPQLEAEDVELDRACAVARHFRGAVIREYSPLL